MRPSTLPLTSKEEGYHFHNSISEHAPKAPVIVTARNTPPPPNPHWISCLLFYSGVFGERELLWSRSPSLELVFPRPFSPLPKVVSLSSFCGFSVVFKSPKEHRRALFSPGDIADILSTPYSRTRAAARTPRFFCIFAAPSALSPLPPRLRIPRRCWHNPSSFQLFFHPAWWIMADSAAPLLPTPGKAPCRLLWKAHQSSPLLRTLSNCQQPPFSTPPPQSF